jgi:signal transduction histidine kinase
MNEPTTAISTPLSDDERARYTEFDRQRGLRLSRIVAMAFAIALSPAALALGLDALLTRQAADPIHAGLAVALAGCIALYLVALWLAQRELGLPATVVLSASTMLAIAAFQVARELGTGIDPVLASAFAAYTIPIGLSGVVGSTRLMFVVTTVTTAVCIAVGVVLPVAVGKTGSAPLLLVMVGIASGVHWLVAILVYGASTLYIRTMHELGDIRTALVRARQLDEMKDQFITNVNHELRTPIMAMQGYIELLRLRHVTMSTERRTALIEKAARASNDLIALVTRILDEQRLGQDIHSFTAQPVILYDELEAALRLIDPREGNMVERELHVHIPDGLQVWGDPIWVRQILNNLLANAVKYSAAGTPVEVAAQPVDDPHLRTSQPDKPNDRSHSMVEIHVRDHGLGIPPQQAPLLFNRFTRLPRDLASNVSGNGLGLYLCRALAAAMGGSIRLESSGIEGEGTTFYVMLPAVPVTATSGTPRRSSTPVSSTVYR